jgi:hypothetical protein
MRDIRLQLGRQAGPRVVTAPVGLWRQTLVVAAVLAGVTTVAVPPAAAQTASAPAEYRFVADFTGENFLSQDRDDPLNNSWDTAPDWYSTDMRGDLSLNYTVEDIVAQSSGWITATISGSFSVHHWKVEDEDADQMLYRGCPPPESQLFMDFYLIDAAFDRHAEMAEIYAVRGGTVFRNLMNGASWPESVAPDVAMWVGRVSLDEVSYKTQDTCGYDFEYAFPSQTVSLGPVNPAVTAEAAFPTEVVVFPILPYAVVDEARKPGLVPSERVMPVVTLPEVGTDPEPEPAPAPAPEPEPIAAPDAEPVPAATDGQNDQPADEGGLSAAMLALLILVPLAVASFMLRRRQQTSLGDAPAQAQPVTPGVFDLPASSNGTPGDTDPGE